MLNYSQTLKHAETICLYLVDRILAPEATFDARLHLIYLINDILHNWFDDLLFHCVFTYYDDVHNFSFG